MWTFREKKQKQLVIASINFWDHCATRIAW